MEYTQLGYFQFNNLIKGRIPMILVNLGVELKSQYGHIEGLHLDNCQVTGTPDEVAKAISDRKLPAHYPIVIIDQDGSKYAPFVQTLESKGFNNVYTVRDGLSGLEKEKAQQ
ncbi:rhodanese-like domain-containing protein [Bdellovibrio sp. GT3]|uniref:rhodanese-like domain-containing protein n=1 Tax=Bdellovibrio sp. GT3 TaxID=3136282 RepID=UPI0030F05BB6